MEQFIVTNYQVEICSGDSVFVGGAYQTGPSVHRDTFIASSGCDSIVNTQVIVISEIITNISLDICDGDSVLIGGEFQTESGIFYDTLSSNAGCDSIVVTQLNVSTLLSITTTVTNVSCVGASDGQISVTVSGGTPGYSYLWSNNANTQSISGLVSGSYSLTVSDIAGCSATISETVSQPAPLALGNLVTHVNCFGSSTGAIELMVGGGTPPYSYFWTPGMQTTEIISGIPAGIDTVVVTDANGCMATLFVTVREPDPITLSAEITDESASSLGEIDLSVIGGTSPYTYIWSNGELTENITVSAGTYTVTVIDANGCEAIDSFTVNSFAPKLASAIEDNQLEQSLIIHVYPVPFKEYLVIEFNSKSSSRATLKLMDLFGRAIQGVLVDVHPGANKFIMHLEHDIPSGMYFLELKTTEQEIAVKTLMR